MNGVETKTAAASATAIVTGLLTWVLVTFVPVFRAGLPPQLATFLPVAVGWALSSAAGYLAPHTPRPPAVIDASAAVQAAIDRAAAGGGGTVNLPPGKAM